MASKGIDSSPCDTLIKKKEDILSEYDVKGIIGKGTFSIVKLGENKLTKEKVAIKIMLKSKIINQEDLIRIAREIEMLKKLNHPNVIKIYKILEDSKQFYIIMEYCENGELFNRIVEKQRLTEDEASLFYYQIISGLEYIHKKKIVHRDLKPENLLLSKDDILKIIDFGLSNYSSFNIMLATPCGSPCYASPEMVSGKKYNGFLIDVWSTGIILFAMICGYLPFEDSNNEILFGKILRCKINYPKHIGELPLDLMKKIIVPEPTKRITLEQIKEHPFFLKGKYLFSQKYPDLFNKKKEIIFRNFHPNNKISNTTINKDRKEKKDNNKRRIFDNNYIINIENINNMNYTYEQPYSIDYLELNKTNENNNKNKILTINTKAIDFSNSNITNDNNKEYFYTEKENNIKDNNIKDNNIKEIIIIPKEKEKEKDNIDINAQKDKDKDNNNNKDGPTESPSSILNPDEIPMDSVPKDYKIEKDNIEVKDNIKDKNNKKNKSDNLTDDNLAKVNIHEKIKEELDTMNMQLTQRLTVNDNYYNTMNNNSNNQKKPKNQSLKEKKIKIKIGDNLKQISDNLTKKPLNNNKIPVNNTKRKKNRIKERIAIEYYPDNKSISNINDYSTTFNSNLDYRYTEVNDNYNKSKYYLTAKELSKTSFANSKINPIYDGDKRKFLIKKIKVKNLTNTAPKNNDKSNNYTEGKYPHNNHTNRVNNTFAKKITNISKFNIDKNNNNKENRNNKNYLKINSLYNSMNIGNPNSIGVDINNNTINETNNKNRLYDIFNELQIMQKNKKRVINQNINLDYFNSFNNSNANNHLNNIIDSYSVEKKKSQIHINSTKILQTDKKNTVDFNKYMNTLSYNKEGSNKIVINTDRDYISKKNTNFTTNGKKINVINDNDNNNNFNKTVPKKNFDGSVCARENTPSYDLSRPYNDKYFDSITINNNNSINFHEPKLYIYVENNNHGNRNKKRNEQHLKTYTNDNISNNKTKGIFRLEKNSKLKNLDTINNAIEQTKKILNKRTTTDIMENNTKDKIINKYGIKKINNNTIINDPNNINKSIIIINNNKKLLYLLKKKNASLHNKNLYTSLNDTIKNNNNYNLKHNEIIFDPVIKNNNRKVTNRSINLVNNYTFNDSENYTIDHPFQYNTNISNRYPNIINTVGTDIIMDGWSYNKGRIGDENIFKNKYYINNNNQRIIHGKHLNTINNYVIKPNNDIEMFDNIDHKIKLQKMQKRKSNNLMNNNNKNNVKSMDFENNKNKIQNNYNIGINNMESLEDKEKTMNIINDSNNSPFIKNNNSNMKNYKKYVKQYYNGKI